MSGCKARCSRTPWRCQVSGQLVARNRQRRESVGQLDQVERAVDEREPARLVFRDHADLDSVHQRQALARQFGGDALRLGIVGRRFGFEELLAKGRVANQLDARGASPRRQPERPGAHRVRGHIIGVGLHHLARHRPGVQRRGEVVVKARAGRAQADAEGVAVERANAFDLLVVVERRLAAARRIAQFRQAEQPGVLEDVDVFGVVLRVVEALDGVDVVLRDQLARPAAERRIVGEEDAGPDAEREAREVGGDLRHRRSGLQAQLQRPGEVVVRQRRLEDARHHRARIEVGDLHRVETGFGGVERDAQRVGDPRHGLRARLLQRGGGEHRRRACKPIATVHQLLTSTAAGPRRCRRSATIGARTPAAGSPAAADASGR